MAIYLAAILKLSLLAHYEIYAPIVIGIVHSGDADFTSRTTTSDGIFIPLRSSNTARRGVHQITGRKLA
jgi:hypothetical protein